MRGSDGAPASIAEAASRLDEILARVKDGKTPLDECLDLLDEAVALGSGAVGLVDAPLTAEEAKGPAKDSGPAA